MSRILQISVLLLTILITVSSVNLLTISLDNHLIEYVDGDVDSETENEKSEDDVQLLSWLDSLSYHAFAYCRRGTHQPCFYETIDCGTALRPPEFI